MAYESGLRKQPPGTSRNQRKRQKSFNAEAAEGRREAQRGKPQLNDFNAKSRRQKQGTEDTNFRNFH